MSANFAPYSHGEEFYLAVKQQHGSDVAAACRAKIEEEVLAGRQPNAEQIRQDLMQKTREVDVALTGIRVKFPY